MLESILNSDSRLLLFLNQFHSHFWDHFMWLVANKWTWIPLYILILYIMQRGQGWKKAAIASVAFALVIACTDQLCGSVLRPFFHRYRPSQVQSGISTLLHLIDGYKGGKYGFPSCHAANSFGLAFFLVLYFKSRILSIFIMVWAVLVSYSRIYMGVHYPSDIVVGMLVGFAVSTLIYFTLKWLYASRLQIAAQYNIIHPCCTQQHMLFLSFGGIILIFAMLVTCFFI